MGIQDMEKSVYRRENIIVRGDAQAKMDRKRLGEKAKLSKGSFHKKLSELKKKLKTISDEANNCDQEIHQLRDHQQEMGGMLEEHQSTTQMLQTSIENKEGDVASMMEVRQMNLTNIVESQQRAKYY